MAVDRKNVPIPAALHGELTDRANAIEKAERGAVASGDKFSITKAAQSAIEMWLKLDGETRGAVQANADLALDLLEIYLERADIRKSVDRYRGAKADEREAMKSRQPAGRQRGAG